MQQKKMSLANIKGKLSRVEMKNIMAGSGDNVWCGANAWMCAYEGQPNCLNPGGSRCSWCASSYTWGCTHN